VIDINIYGNPLSFDESVSGLLKKVGDECTRTGRMSCLVRATFLPEGLELRFRISIIEATKRAAPIGGSREAAR
jgi:hypothetical protein